MKTGPRFHSLAMLAGSLRSGALGLLDYLTDLESLFQRREPDVLAFVPEDGRFHRLRLEAEELLRRFPDPDNRPPLFGIPVGVKDIFHVDGFVTRAGSRLPAHLFAGPEADSVAHLRRAGALILGKTVTTEFAFFSPGPTRNPYNPAHTPGGSSSGSAAAVATGLCPMALGTQTIGSVNRPAAFCGVVGFKPSQDRISAAGVIPLSPTLDHVGFFTPDVSGADLVASQLCPHWQIVVTSRLPVLGVPEGPYLEQATSEGLAHFRKTCARLETAGFVVRAVPAMADFARVQEDHFQLVLAEMAQVHAPWYDQFVDLYRPKTADLIRQGQQINEKFVEWTRRYRRQFRRKLTLLMDEHGIDLWLSPSAPGPAPVGLESTGDPVMNLPWTYAGLPTLTLPSGFSDNGLPLGLQVTGRWYADEAVLSWAEELEPFTRPQKLQVDMVRTHR